MTIMNLKNSNDGNKGPAYGGTAKEWADFAKTRAGEAEVLASEVASEAKAAMAYCPSKWSDEVAFHSARTKWYAYLSERASKVSNAEYAQYWACQADAASEEAYMTAYGLKKSLNYKD